MFPSERSRLEAVAEEASLSRLYAGIRYRFGHGGRIGTRLQSGHQGPRRCCRPV